MPPAVALLDYISNGILLRIFSQTGIFAGFSLRMYIYIAGPVGYYTGAHTVVFRGVFSLYFSPDGRAKLRWASRWGVILGCRIAYKGAMDGARGGVLCTKALVVQ